MLDLSMSKESMQTLPYALDGISENKKGSARPEDGPQGRIADGNKRATNEQEDVLGERGLWTAQEW
jgi:hypothetical protein